MPSKQQKSQRRKRTTMTSEQHAVLRKAFVKNIFPDIKKRQELGEICNLCPKTVQIWFQNQRQRAKSMEDNFVKYIYRNSKHVNNNLFMLEVLCQVASYEYDARKDTDVFNIK